MTQDVKRRESLWTPIVAPVIGAVHFMACYIWAAMACGRSGAGLDQLRTALTVMTVVACAAIAWLLVYGFRRHGSRLPDRPNDDGTIEDRSRFMALTTMLLAAMSLIATVFVGAAAVAAGGCQ